MKPQTHKHMTFNSMANEEEVDRIMRKRWAKEFNGYVPESEDEAIFLRQYDPSKFPITVVTVDTVITKWFSVPGLGPYDGESRVLLIKRGNYPYKDRWALPGGFIDPNETAQQAAAREVKEETGMGVVDVTFSHIADAPDRDPRGRAISMVFKSRAFPDQEAYAGDDAVEAEWFPYHSALTMDLAFDHNEILRKTL